MPDKVVGNAGRRAVAMAGIPSVVAVPKFLTPGEIVKVKDMKSDIPELSWEEAIIEVVKDSRVRKRRR